MLSLSFHCLIEVEDFLQFLHREMSSAFLFITIAPDHLLSYALPECVRIRLWKVENVIDTRNTKRSRTSIEQKKKPINLMIDVCSNDLTSDHRCATARERETKENQDCPCIQCTNTKRASQSAQDEGKLTLLCVVILHLSSHRDLNKDCVGPIENGS
jgi:hypothetical protein